MNAGYLRKLSVTPFDLELYDFICMAYRLAAVLCIEWYDAVCLG